MPLGREGLGEDCPLGCLPQKPRCCLVCFPFCSVLSLVRLICANFLECPVSFLCAFWSSFQAFLFLNFCFKMLVQGHMLDMLFHDFLVPTNRPQRNSEVYKLISAAVDPFD